MTQADISPEQIFAAINDGLALRDYCKTRLLQHAAKADVDPQTNSVKLLALELSAAIRSGALNPKQIGDLVQHLAEDTFQDRAAAERRLHRLEEGGEKQAALRSLLETQAAMGWDSLCQTIETPKTGLVFTAHPTFAMRAALRDRLALAIEGRDPGPDGGPHLPDDPVDLVSEHEAALGALEKAQAALDTVHAAALDVARDAFPDRWTDLTPCLATLATWVGYDLDGRSDIHWSKTLQFRLMEKARALQGYADDLNPVLGPSHALVQRLRAAARSAQEEAYLFDGDLADPAIVVKAANRLTGPDPDRLVRLDEIIVDLDQEIAHLKMSVPDQAYTLILIKARMQMRGLGAARIHLRVNAAQVRAAVRADLGVEEGVSDFGRVAMARAADRAAAAKARRVNFASVFTEQMTARRQFMLCAQILKHIDADTPIRFLIAETERPATIMGALYLAKLYGVAHRLDISPLFETPDALERGGRFMEQLLDEPGYRAYIAERGTLAIQIGFSDSGRFMGQVAAQLAAERVQILLARAMQARGITGVTVLLFNTHGESMGRGAHPAGFDARFDHLFTPWARARFARAAIPVVHETSFQGGDGFVHFQTPILARSTLMSVLVHDHTPVSVAEDDPFYQEINFTWDVYRALKLWQEHLFENPSYRIALSRFVPQMLVATGSRKAKRLGGADTQLRNLRAIPNNASLQQLAIPANVCGGLGSAMAKEADRFAALFQHSSRAQALLKLVDQARSLTSLPVLRAYGGLYDAGLWVALAARQDDEGEAQACLDLADRVAAQGADLALYRLAHHLGADLIHLDAMLAHTGLGQSRTDRHAGRLTLHLLHAIRLALLMEAFLLVAHMPTFSRRHDVTREDVIDLVLGLRLNEAIALLDRIFPAELPAAEALSAIQEPSDEGDDTVHGYPEIQAHVVRPLEALKPVLEEISVAISHAYGAWG